MHLPSTTLSALTLAGLTASTQSFHPSGIPGNFKPLRITGTDLTAPSQASRLRNSRFFAVNGLNHEAYNTNAYNDPSLNTWQQQLFKLNTGRFLSKERSETLKAGLTSEPFTTLTLDASFRKQLDQAIIQFDPKSQNTRQLSNQHQSVFQQYYFNEVPIAAHSPKGFQTASKNLDDSSAVTITGADFGDTLATYLSLTTGQQWVCELMVIYCIEGGATTFPAHVDALQVHGTYSPIDTPFPQPTTPFMNQACLDATRTSSKREFIDLMRSDKNQVTDTLREKGTYLPLGEVAIFAGKNYPYGDGLGMPHAGPRASDHPRRFLGFHFTEVTDDFDDDIYF